MSLSPWVLRNISFVNILKKLVMHSSQPPFLQKEENVLYSWKNCEQMCFSVSLLTLRCFSFLAGTQYMQWRARGASQTV